MVGAAALADAVQPIINTDNIIPVSLENMKQPMNGPVLVAEHLSMKVSSPEGSLTILDDVSVHINTGETIAIIGASGAGKSTLLALLAGLDTPTSGTVTLNGIELTQLDEDGRAALRAQHVGFVFQSFHLVPSLTALENIMLPLELAGQTNARDKALVALKNVGLQARAGHYPNQLSGGEQQRVAIARAFVTNPAVLFADEPTGNLDTATGEKVIQQLFDMNAATRTTLVLVTHDQALAARCQRIIKLDMGRVVNA
jgi:putative ABC transport system ATP-binding protein